MQTISCLLRRLAFVSASFAVLTACPSSWAGDRPFLDTNTAMVEDDDERTFEFSTWLVKLKQERALQAALEYNFSPTLSAEVELGWSKNKLLESKERSLELGLRKVWIDPARQGWGLGTNFSVGWARQDDTGWKAQSIRTVMAYSLPLLEKQVWLHANAGVERLQEERKTYGVASLALQGQVRKDITLFGEVARRPEKENLLQGGVRWWAKKDKVALDVSVGKLRPQDDESRKFISLGLSLYDLDYK
jgi:hypothetical protein